jgi:hypothetical protein
MGSEEFRPLVERKPPVLSVKIAPDYVWKNPAWKMNTHSMRRGEV